MLPKVQFIISYPYSKPKVIDAQLSDREVIYSGVEVNEFQKVHLKFTCKGDANATLLIETYNSEDIEELKPSENEVEIMNGENAEYMLVPGNHRIEVFYLGKQYFSYFTIQSKHFSNQALVNLRIYLEKMLKGLSHDLVKQKFGMATPLSDKSLTLLQLFKFLFEHKNQIVRNLDYICRDPLSNLYGEYQVTSISKRPDDKSNRWHAKKGGLVNGTNLKPRLYYEKHARITCTNIENQWIRYIIKFFINSLRKLDISFQKEDIILQNKIEYQEKQQDINKEKIVLASKNKYGYELQLSKLRDNDKRFSEQIIKLTKEKNLYNQQKLFIRQLTKYFSQKEELFWLQSLSGSKPNKVTKRMLKDSRYRRFYMLYKELSKLENNDINSKIPGITFKRTWQLFEYYSLGIIIDMLKENGYLWLKGWLADKANPHLHIGTLASDTQLIFEHPQGNHYVEVAYDTEVESSIVDKSYSRYFNQAGRKPDIRITIFKKDGSLYSDKAGLIIESKCRRHYYIMNDKIDPDIKYQLRDYISFEYFDSNSKTSVVHPISKVIVLYPRQNGKQPVERDHVYGDGMIFIQIEPSNPESNEKPFGYNNLKERIDEFLSQVKESEDILI